MPKPKTLEVTVKINCGCGQAFYNVKDACSHSDSTGHVIDSGGVKIVPLSSIARIQKTNLERIAW